MECKFTMSFYKFTHAPSKNISNKFLKDLLKGLLRSCKSYSGCVVNDYKFITTSYRLNSTIMNSGVCIMVTNYTTYENDYYGQLIAWNTQDYQSSKPSYLNVTGLIQHQI